MTMMCNDLDIKALLPAYLDKMLSLSDNDRIEKHLFTCEDCRTELSLLRMLSEEPVPDPGGAFWAAMPGKIFREVQAQEQRKSFQWLPFGWGRLIIPRWAWAAATVFLVTVVVFFLARPAPLDIAYDSPQENGASYGDLLLAEPVDMAELTDVEIDSVDIWATGELALLRDDVIDIFKTSPDISIDDRLAELDAQELEHFSRKLDTENEEG
jgi:hypothetical protein